MINIKWESLKIFLPFCFILFSQSIVLAENYSVAGIVVEAKSKQPVSGATVFINNTSKYTVTDSNGKYFLADITDKYFEIVCTKKGYETLSIQFEAKVSINNIRFEPTAFEAENALPDSVVKQQQDKWGSRFTTVFLGISKNAKECEIANPDVLHFEYNDSSKILSISTDAPLVIFNEALGYMITCVFDDFFITDKNEVIYKIFKWYKPLTSQKTEIVQKWREERKFVYQNSMLRFMRAFNADSLKQRSYEVKRITRIYTEDSSYRRLSAILKETNSDFVGISGTGKKTYAELIDKKPVATSLFRNADSIISIFGNGKALQVVYRNTDNEIAIIPVSYLVFNGNKHIRVEASGAYFKEADISVSGYWYFQRLGDLLPFDY